MPIVESAKLSLGWTTGDTKVIILGSNLNNLEYVLFKGADDEQGLLVEVSMIDNSVPS